MQTYDLSFRRLWLSVHAEQNSLANMSTPSTLVMLNAQWRGGSTLAEQLLFQTMIATPFLMDEPAKARWDDKEHHSVARANLGALQCDFSLFNETMLVDWQHWRGVFTRQKRALSHASIDAMRARCTSHGHIRALKTIRMGGELGEYADACERQARKSRWPGRSKNISCVLIQMVRHPLSTIKSEGSNSKLPQAEAGSRVPTPGGEQKWLETRTRNMTTFCEPILRDVQAALALQKRREKLSKPFPANTRDARAKLLTTAPRVVVLKYDQVLREPAEAVRRVHEAMGAWTDRRKLVNFLWSNLGIAANVSEIRSLGAQWDPAAAAANATGAVVPAARGKGGGGKGGGGKGGGAKGGGAKGGGAKGGGAKGGGTKGGGAKGGGAKGGGAKASIWKTSKAGSKAGASKGSGGGKASNGAKGAKGAKRPASGVAAAAAPADVVPKKNKKKKGSKAKDSKAKDSKAKGSKAKAGSKGGGVASESAAPAAAGGAEPKPPSLFSRPLALFDAVTGGYFSPGRRLSQWDKLAVSRWDQPQDPAAWASPKLRQPKGGAHQRKSIQRASGMVSLSPPPPQGSPSQSLWRRVFQGQKMPPAIGDGEDEPSVGSDGKVGGAAMALAGGSTLQLLGKARNAGGGRPSQAAAAAASARKTKNATDACDLTEDAVRCKRQHKLRSAMKKAFGVGKKSPKKCEKVDAMREWPLCDELIRLLEPIYLC